MKKQHAITQDYFERLASLFQMMMKFVEARSNKRKIRAIYMDAELSAHIRKDIGLDYDSDVHLRR